MAEPFATVQDMEVTLGVTYDETEAAQVTRLIRNVSALIRQRRPLLDEHIASGAISTDVVEMVTCQVVARYMSTIENGGVGLRSERHPEYGYTLTDSAANGYELTDDELADLTPAAQQSMPFSIIPR